MAAETQELLCRKNREESAQGQSGISVHFSGSALSGSGGLRGLAKDPDNLRKVFKFRSSPKETETKLTSIVRITLTFRNASLVFFQNSKNILSTDCFSAGSFEPSKCKSCEHGGSGCSPCLLLPAPPL